MFAPFSALSRGIASLLLPGGPLRLRIGEINRRQHLPRRNRLRCWRNRLRAPRQRLVIDLDTEALWFLLRERTRIGLGFIEPCLPSPAKAPPSGPGWIHEIKYDGLS
jgi:ATP-dependent DNA ligase